MNIFHSSVITRKKKLCIYGLFVYVQLLFLLINLSVAPMWLSLIPKLFISLTRKLLYVDASLLYITLVECV